MSSRELTPKRVARAIGVSESSLKRWCDRGLIPYSKTAGGHRRIALDAVLEFLRSTQRELVRPEILGLPATSGRGHRVVARAVEELQQSLLSGDEQACRQIVLDLFLSGRRVSAICDEVLASAFHSIGERWACGSVHVYQERHGCEICQHILQELRNCLPSPSPTAPRALGGTPDGDPYTLPTKMIETVLVQAGWRADSLGTRIPLTSLAAAVHHHRPRLVWLSISHVENGEAFLDSYRDFYDAVGAETVIVVGGQALTEPLRQRMDYAAFCDSMRHLESFARTLHQLVTPELSATEDGWVV